MAQVNSASGKICINEENVINGKQLEQLKENKDSIDLPIAVKTSILQKQNHQIITFFYSITSIFDKKIKSKKIKLRNEITLMQKSSQ